MCSSAKRTGPASRLDVRSAEVTLRADTWMPTMPGALGQAAFERGVRVYHLRECRSWDPPEARRLHRTWLGPRYPSWSSVWSRCHADRG